MIRALAWVACLLTVCITASSAFIRHAQSGVGCEPWPECYAQAHSAKTSTAATAASSAPSSSAPSSSAPASVAEPSPAGQASPAVASSVPRPVQVARALHRVSAMAVGILVLLIAVFGWSTMTAATRVALTVALADTFFLAWLGRLTPHELPLVTIGNLLGGFLLAAAFAWIAAATPRRRGAGSDGDAASDGVSVSRELPSARSRAAMLPALGAIVLLAGSAWVGTMIGAHRAIDACTGPSCHEGAYLDASALDPTRPAAALDDGGARGLHVLHRVLGAAFALCAAFVAWRIRHRPAIASSLVAATIAQWLLGVGTALGTNPLLTTTTHNALAASLVVLLAAIASRAQHAGFRPSRYAAPAVRAARTPDRVPRAH